jgi:hypothetical protein
MAINYSKLLKDLGVKVTLGTNDKTMDVKPINTIKLSDNVLGDLD